MSSNLRWKAITIVLVLLACGAVVAYPVVAERVGSKVPSWLEARRLKLGLDLKGGVHLVLRVQTDEALRTESTDQMERLRETLTRSDVGVSGMAVVGPTQFRVDGVPRDQDVAFRQATIEVERGFERVSGGEETYIFTMRGPYQLRVREDAVVQARETIERRVNELGVSEPSIARQGANGDEILVQLPGVTAIERAKTIIRSTGRLDFKIVERGPTATKEELFINGHPPDLMEIVPRGGDVDDDSGATTFYLVRTTAAVSGRELRSARPSLDENGRPAVTFTLNAEGARKFGAVTGDNIGRELAVVLDGRVQSVARIEGRISGEGRIAGNFTQEEVQNLSLILRSGSLAAPLAYVEERMIGPSLGADSIRSGITASIVGLLLVIAFMVSYYSWSGINAVIALLANLILLLGLMAYVGAVMTLPGIAGFVLTMGIGVDSNVLIFERIKEELESGQGPRAAIHAGFARVFLTLLDTHVAALISAACLFQFGTGPIRGFAVTLFVGLVSNLFTATFVSKTLFEFALSGKQRADLSI